MRKPGGPDFIRMACTTASVSYKESLTPDELVRAFLSGEVARDRRPHIRMLLEEGSPSLIAGLIHEVGRLATPAQVAANIKKIASELDVLERVQEQLKKI